MYDPDISLSTIQKMKEGLDAAGKKAFLMMQPVGFHTQEIDKNPDGYFALPEFPFGNFFFLAVIFFCCAFNV